MPRATRWDVVVVGGANTDFLVRGADLPAAGQTVDGDEFQEAPGGKGANQAVAAARLGARTALVARVGRDRRGDELAAQAAADGVDLEHLASDPDAPTGAAVIHVGRDGQKQILTAPGANSRLTVADVRAAAATIRAAGVVLAQLEVPVEAVAEALAIGRAAGARVVLDPAPARPLPDEVIRLVDVIRPNSKEAEALTGMAVRDRATARRAAERLLARGAGAACVQAGEEGDLLVWPGGEAWLPRLPVETVDATGAGDSFAAALAVQLAEGASWEAAGRFASAAAALATTVLGAQGGLPRRDEVQALLARVGSRSQT
jgi:ribokinase